MSGSVPEISDALTRDIEALGSRVTPRALMSELTTFRLGGPCAALIDCPNAEAVQAAWAGLHREGIPRMLIGGGSNLLVNDAGTNRAVVRFADPDAEISQEGGALHVSAGMNLDALAARTAEQGLDSVIYCSGIPGTVGGAVAGNAGAFGEQIGDHLISATVMNGAGEVEERGPADLGFAYRRSSLQGTEDVVLAVTLSCIPVESDTLFGRRDEILALRAGKHPDWKSVPTAGSFFKNIEPTSKAGRRQAAGWFLQEAGAMAMRVGGARTFEKHANIVVADEGCKAADVVALTDKMAAAVKEKFDLTLEREVKLVGF